ncbi:MAG: HEAT repeat domain-containing protein [Thermoanaerobaculia bacterium]
MRPTSALLRAGLCLALCAGLVSCQSAGSGTATSGAATREKPGSTPAARSVSDLRRDLRDPDMSVRLRATEELGPRAASSDEAAAALVEALADSAALVRRFAAGGLADVKAPSTAMVLALARVLRDPEIDPRESAARSLASLAPRVPFDSVKDLGSALAAAAGDKEASVRSWAVQALGALGAPAARQVPAIKPALERALGDPVPEVRAAAAQAAGQLGTGVPWAMGLLIRALADPLHDVKKHAVVALEKIGPEAAPATRALARQLRAKEIYLRVFAADALTAIGPGARAALPELKAMVARGWKEIQGSPEMEAKDLPDAVARAIRSIEAKEPKKRTARTAPEKTAARTAAESPVAGGPPGSVKGHFEEINTGAFDLVDGIAYPASGGNGTVVYAANKPLASAALADSPCPMTYARAIASLRDAGYVEVTLDSAGRSKYFGYGLAFGGSGREDEVGGKYWSSTLKLSGGRAVGNVDHKDHGGFEFDLPLSSPKVREVSEADGSNGRRADPSAPALTEPPVTAAYRAVREAALRKDLNTLLAAQGFDGKQISAISKLDGIGADLERYSNRFLKPGAPSEFQNGPGYGAVAGSGTNAKGAKFINYYWFTSCRGKLVLFSISENPQ